jgi:hypothetical protein
MLFNQSAEGSAVGVLPSRGRRGTVLAVVGGLLAGVAAIALAWSGDVEEPPAAERPNAVAEAVASVDAPTPTPAMDRPAAGPFASAPVETPSVARNAATSTEVVAVAATPWPEAHDAAAEPEPTSRRRRAHRRRSRPTAVPEATQPEPAPAPVRKRQPAPPSAADLLREAQVSLARGDARAAFRLAKRSHDARPSDAALKVMTRSACRVGNDDVALSTLRRLPLSTRASIRRDCRKSGNRIPI